MLNTLVKKNILIIGKKINETTAFGSAEYFTQCIKDYTEDSIEFVHFDDLSFHLYSDTFSIIAETSQKDLKDYDLVFFRDWFVGGKDDVVLAISFYLQHHSIPLLNKEALMGRSRGKLSQHVLGRIYGAHYPYTFSGSQHAIESFVNNGDFFGFPCVVKASNASRGRDNFLVLNMQELVDAYAEIGDKRVLLQEYVPNSADFRVLMFQDEALMVIKRQRSTDSRSHLNNTSQGAEAKKVSLDVIPNSVLKHCAEVSNRLGRTFTGVDIIEDQNNKGRFLCLEINNMPQLETGAYREDKLKIVAEILSRSAKKEN